MKRLALALAVITATPAWAQADEPRFCPNRPDLGSSTCTTDPGRLLVELSGVDWQRDESATMREDRIAAGDLLARFGISPRSEVQVSWTSFVRVRTRDKGTGVVDTVTGSGDIRLGLRRNLQNQDGSGLSFAVEPYVTLPVGRESIGAGDWSAGAVIPASYGLGRQTSLLFTGTLSAAVDEDGRGRHFAANGTIGLGRTLTDTLSGVAELSITRNQDPAGAATEAFGAASLAWQPRPNRQLDVLAIIGLKRDLPDLRLVFGGAVLF